MRRNNQLTETELLDDAASLMKLMAEPMRLRLLALLREGEYCVKDLVEETGAGQANISKHLSLMSMSGIVARRKEGLFAYYYVSNPAVFDIFDCVIEAISEKD
jgi:DNA-binding transcriptional ArsR family regulator